MLFTELIVRNKLDPRPGVGTTGNEKSFTMFNGSYIIKDVTGLGPVPTDISMMDSAFYGGGVWNSSSPNTRNIVITIRYKPNHANGETVTSLRDELYSWFMTGTALEMDFVTPNKGVLRITGHVETHEPVIFSANPVSVISILCPQPNFVAVGAPTVFTWNRAENPTSFSYIYDGTASVGFNVEGTFTSSSTLVSISGDPVAVRGRASIARAWVSGESFRISTTRNKKGAWRISSGITYSALDGLTGNLSKFRLYPGLNEFYCTTGSPTLLTFTYYKEYGAL